MGRCKGDGSIGSINSSALCISSGRDLEHFKPLAEEPHESLTVPAHDVERQRFQFMDIGMGHGTEANDSDWAWPRA